MLHFCFCFFCFSFFWQESVMCWSCSEQQQCLWKVCFVVQIFFFGPNEQRFSFLYNFLGFCHFYIQKWNKWNQSMLSAPFAKMSAFLQQCSCFLFTAFWNVCVVWLCLIPLFTQAICSGCCDSVALCVIEKHTGMTVVVDGIVQRCSKCSRLEYVTQVCIALMLLMYPCDT